MEPLPVRGPSTETIVRVFLTVLGLAVLTLLAYEVRSVLELVFIAAFLAVALGPAVDRVGRILPRAGAILAVYVAILAAIVGVGLLVVPPVVTQVEQLSNDIPGYVQDLRDNKTFRDYDNKYDISKKLNQQAAKLPSRLGSAVGALQSVTVGIFSTLVQLISVLTMTFFMLLEGQKAVEWVIRASGKREPRVRGVAEEIYRSTSGYVAGNLVISVLAGVSAFVVMELLGVPFSVPLAVLMAFLDLIPLVGASIGGLIIGIITAFNDFPTDTIVWAIFFVIYQQAENNVLQPVIYRRTVSVAPLIVIVAILIGSSLLGVLGALVAIPVAAAVQVVVRDLWAHRPGAEPETLDADEPTPEPAAEAA